MSYALRRRAAVERLLAKQRRRAVLNRLLVLARARRDGDTPPPVPTWSLLGELLTGQPKALDQENESDDADGEELPPPEETDLLAETRQWAWSTGNAPTARALTRMLNGHDSELRRDRRRDCYFDTDGGAWARRRRRRFLSRPDGVHPPADPSTEIAEIMRQPELCENHGRARVWTGGHVEESWDIGCDTGDREPRAKWNSLGEPVVADYNGAGGQETTHVESDHNLAHSQADLVWLVYDHSPRRYTLAEHHEALHHRGRHLPERLRFAKAEAERLVVELLAAGVSEVNVAHHFEISPATVGRIRDRNLNVAVAPIGGDPDDDRLAQAAVLQLHHRREAA